MEILPARDVDSKSKNAEKVDVKKSKPKFREIEGEKFNDWLEKMENGEEYFHLSV